MSEAVEEQQSIYSVTLKQTTTIIHSDLIDQSKAQLPNAAWGWAAWHWPCWFVLRSRALVVRQCLPLQSALCAFCPLQRTNGDTTNRVGPGRRRTYMDIHGDVCYTIAEFTTDWFICLKSPNLWLHRFFMREFPRSQTRSHGYPPTVSPASAPSAGFENFFSRTRGFTAGIYRSCFRVGL